MKSAPRELYGLMLTDLGTTSRALHYETNRFRDIDLRNASMDLTLSWTNTVSHKSTLCAFVHTLYLPKYAPVDF